MQMITLAFIEWFNFISRPTLLSKLAHAKRSFSWQNSLVLLFILSCKLIYSYIDTLLTAVRLLSLLISYGPKHTKITFQ